MIDHIKRPANWEVFLYTEMYVFIFLKEINAVHFNEGHGTCV